MSVTINLGTVSVTRSGVQIAWGVVVPPPIQWGTFSPITYASSNQQFSSSIVTAPENASLYITISGFNTSRHEFIFKKDGTNQTMAASQTINVTANQQLQITGATKSNQSASSGTIQVRLNNSSGKIIDDFTYSLAKTSTCFLTTTMVEYYGLLDDGPELTAMRELREVYQDKHAQLLESYYADSQIIIEEIERNHLENTYYPKIKGVVDNIVILVNEKKWEEAETLYINLYYDLAQEFGLR